MAQEESVNNSQGQYSDGTEITSIYANDPMIAEIIPIFLSNLPKRVTAIEENCKVKSWDEVSKVAHQLKGAAGGYGFTAVSDLARFIEEKAKTGEDLSALQSAISKLRAICNRLMTNSNTKIGNS